MYHFTICVIFWDTECMRRLLIYFCVILYIQNGNTVSSPRLRMCVVLSSFVSAYIYIKRSHNLHTKFMNSFLIRCDIIRTKNKTKTNKQQQQKSSHACVVISSVLIVYTDTRHCMYGVADTFRQGTGGVVGERSAQQVLLRSSITKRPMNPLKHSALPVRT